MRRPLCALFACVVVAQAQVPSEAFDRLASKDDAVAAEARRELVAQGEALIPELERRLAKRPPERVAARLRSVLRAIQLGDLDALLTPRVELPDSAPIPAAISPDGTRVAYVSRRIDADSRSFEYRVATLTDDGLKSQTLLACAPGTRDDYVVSALLPGCWSPDGTKLGYVDGVAEGVQATVCGYLDVETGAATPLGDVAGNANLSVRFHPQGDRVAWITIDPAAMQGNVHVRELKSGETHALSLPEAVIPVDLRYLPDGRALILVARMPDAEAPGRGRPLGQLCVVSADGKQASLVEPAVAPDAYFWDGPPRLLVPPGGGAALLEARNPETGRKRPSQLWALDPSGEQSRLVLPDCSWSPIGAIDARRVSVFAHDKSAAGVVDLETGEVSPLDHKRTLLHRRGERAVILDLETRTLWVN